MIARRARIIAVWLLGVAAAVWVVAQASYITDMSAFLPAKPTALQKVLVDQLRDGPASRLILIALEGGAASLRAQLSTTMAARLRRAAGFTSLDNGESSSAERDRDFLFAHRYQLSSSVDAQRFTAAGLREAIGETLENLSGSTGLMLKSLVPHDPTGEMLNIVDQLAGTRGPRTENGVWVSADGARTLLVAQTAAPGSDTDAQERDLGAIRDAFRDAADAAGPAASAICLQASGPGVFAAAARAKIKQSAMRLSLLSSLLVTAVLLTVYRSITALILGLLPVASGALAGVAAVALGFGAVHGITLGFGVTLIGESVDYSIYFFIQSQRQDGRGPAAESWQRALWPTIRLGMLTSVCGFASLLPSGFPGLAQLGLYSISGLVAAALVTRFVLPELLPEKFKVRDVAPLGVWIGRRRDRWRRSGSMVAAGACVLGAAALCVLYAHRATLWNRELSRLSPVSAQDLRLDATLRSDLGAADVLDLVIVSGSTLEAVLEGAESAGAALQPLLGRKIGGFDSPANYLPSRSAQQMRIDALPDRHTLQSNVRTAARELTIKDDLLAPFVDDVETARRGAPLSRAALAGTTLAAGFDALILHQPDHWSALLPLHAVDSGAGMAPNVDLAGVAAALATAHLRDTQVLDMKAQTDALYASYLQEAIRLSLCGFLLIVLLLLYALRSPMRVARALAPLILAVLCVAAGLASLGQQLTLLHLVGMLLIVAVGSNYALFFDHESACPPGGSTLTLASLCIANVSTVIGFGLLAFSGVPVLEALGATVAPGALLALVFAALMTSAPRPAAAVLVHA